MVKKTQKTAKNKPKTAVKSQKIKPTKANQGVGIKKGQQRQEVKSIFVTHWLQDASLEVSQPMGSYAPGERQLDFTVRARELSLPQPNYLKLELRLRAHIYVSSGPVALAEVSYAAVVEKAHNIPDILQSLYPYARESLELVLKLSGHTPPIPQNLDKS